MGGAKCMGQLNCAIDSHSTGMWAPQQSLVVQFMQFVHYHHLPLDVTPSVSWPCILSHQRSNIKSCHWKGTVDPPSALSYWKMSGCCHLVNGALSPYEIANICHWSLQVLALCQWDNTKTKLLAGVKGNHCGKLLRMGSHKGHSVRMINSCCLCN